MLYFTIALRSKESSKNWANVVENFNHTLHSIYNQIDPNFQVYVGCNEIPKLYESYGNSLHFVVVDTPKPRDWLEGCRDRAWKLLACCKSIKEENMRGGNRCLYFRLMQMII